jgi:hypothetical protein
MPTKTRKKSQKLSSVSDAVREVDPLFAPIVEAFAGNKLVARKRMFSSHNVLSVRNKIFAMLSRGNFVAKLPKARVDELVAKGVGKHFDPGHGRLMKEWLSVPSGKASWIDLAKEAYAFVSQSKS